jgi:serine/threonine protein kinase
MKTAQLQSDLLFCRQCRRHFRGKKRVCPTDGATLELVTAFMGRAGDVLDQRYMLLETIGVGGMGTVYRARDELTDREVALKLLRSEYASNATSAQRFLQEARLLRLVQHPNVTGLHRFGRTAEGLLLIDMELVEGESVRDRILRHGGKGLDIPTALGILETLLSALTACHQAGVVHCDIKPENLLMPREGTVSQVKLLDFGIAQVPGPVVQNEDIGVVGTPAYMTPEQVRARHVDARTDMYLAGCVAYELLTGDPPFLGATPLDLCHQQLLTPPPPLASRMDVSLLPAGFDEWLQPLLEKDPTMRPTSTRMVRDALRRMRHDARISLGTEHTTLRPPSVLSLRRPEASPEVPQLHVEPPKQRSNGVEQVRALIEIRQIEGGVTYGPEAIEQIARHVLAGTLADLRDNGADVAGPRNQRIEVRMRCNGDERGVISHLLDCVADMQAQLARIPEPRLDIRAAVVGDLPASPEHPSAPMGLDPLQLLTVSPVTQIRVDEHVARWAGRRALVKLASVPSLGRPRATDIYATSLLPV